MNGTPQLSSAACIALLTFYLSCVLRSLTRGLTFGAMLTTLYAAVYGLLISEDNALIPESRQDLGLYLHWKWRTDSCVKFKRTIYLQSKVTW